MYLETTIKKKIIHGIQYQYSVIIFMIHLSFCNLPIDYVFPVIDWQLLCSIRILLHTTASWWTNSCDSQIGSVRRLHSHAYHITRFNPWCQHVQRTDYLIEIWCSPQWDRPRCQNGRRDSIAQSALVVGVEFDATDALPMGVRGTNTINSTIGLLSR